MLLLSFSSCKKQTETPESEITPQQVLIESVTSSQIDMSYQLSHLGYQQTGVSFYKKGSPGATTVVNAIRKNDLLRLSLQNLESNTEYVIKIFYKKGDQQHLDVKDYTVKTLSVNASKFALSVVEAGINYDDAGNFSFEIEGENLQNINLSELVIRVNATQTNLSYPINISGNRYRMRISGKGSLTNMNYPVQAVYQGNELLFKSVPFKYDGERYWASYEPTNLRGYNASVFNNQLFYFFNNQAYRWDDAGQRMITLGNIPSGTISANAVGIDYDETLFFSAVDKSLFLNPNNLLESIRFPEAYGYVPSTGNWLTFSFKEFEYAKTGLVVGNCNYFIHKGLLYLTFSIGSNPGNGPVAGRVLNKYVYKYNKASKGFERVAEINLEMINFHIVSVNNQLFILGNIPVIDQGFKLSTTFAVYSLSDNFNLQEVYRGGTINDPIDFVVKNALPYGSNILLATGISEYRLYDPAENKIHQVYNRNSISNMYFGGFFTYNNKFHLNADIGFTSYKIYELSILKGR